MSQAQTLRIPATAARSKRFASWMAGLVAWCMAVIGLVLVAGPQAQAKPLEIDITQGNVAPLPIAIPTFNGLTPDERRIGEEIARVVSADLDRSGLFRILDPASFIETNVGFESYPRFADWRLIKADALLVGRVQLDPQGRLSVGYRFWDIYAETTTPGLDFPPTSPDNWRKIAHQIADHVYETLTGEKGYFDTRIVFISETGPKINRIKRLTIMDQDGANPSFLTRGTAMVLTPRFNPANPEQISYISYESGFPRVMLMNVNRGVTEVLGAFPGTTFGARFSPDGRFVALTMEADGNSEIYLMSLASRSFRRLTQHPDIDTSPSFSPDAQLIAFNSDRGGSSQIYVMNADGTGARRISYGDGAYETPVWSPRGDLIAFTKRKGGRFHIGVMKPDGSGERLLTDGYLVESPTWSPNGRVIMFTREELGREPQIWSIDLTGRNLRMVSTIGAASDPAWSAPGAIARKD